MSSPQITVRGCRCCTVPSSSRVVLSTTSHRYRQSSPSRCCVPSPSHPRASIPVVTPAGMRPSPCCRCRRRRCAAMALAMSPSSSSLVSSSHWLAHTSAPLVVIDIVPAGTHVCPHLLVVIVVAPAGTRVHPPLVVVDVVPPWHWPCASSHRRRRLMHAYPYTYCRRAAVAVSLPCFTSSSSLLWACVLSLLSSLPPCLGIAVTIYVAIVVTVVVPIHRLHRRSYRPHRRCHRHRHRPPIWPVVVTATCIPLVSDWAYPRIVLLSTTVVIVCVVIVLLSFPGQRGQAVPATVYGMEMGGCWAAQYGCVWIEIGGCTQGTCDSSK